MQDDHPHRRLQAHLILHGAIVLFVGLFAGAPYNAALLRGWGSEPVRAWVLAHSAGVMCGIMALAAAGIMHRLALSDLRARMMAGSFIVSIYAFTIGMWLAALLPVRGIVASRSIADRLVNICYTIGAWGALAGAALAVAGAAAALRAIPRRNPQSATRHVSTIVTKNDM